MAHVIWVVVIWLISHRIPAIVTTTWVESVGKFCPVIVKTVPPPVPPLNGLTLVSLGVNPKE